jgi:hypothetical protein
MMDMFPATLEAKLRVPHVHSRAWQAIACLRYAVDLVRSRPLTTAFAWVLAWA